ncbi:serine hydroxymethyltransferase [Candidatus Woesebacteria bacterium]|nr:serine hydroxymethyltransferase [Candidatus Woesebacteria bacterium]
MDKRITQLLAQEEKRQRETINLIPSENYASKQVRNLVGSIFANKYSEGYPGRRYYQGNTIVDQVENLAVERAKKLFGVPHANVQPYSGSPANSAVLFVLCDTESTIMGMELASGGHLTHGHPGITFSGKYFNSVQFGTDKSGLIDYDAVGRLAKKVKPKVMIIGTTAYPLILDWQKFAQIANSVGAYLVADIAHVAGLVVSGVYPNPVPYAHIITTTTHKSLRGPRGAIVMVTDKGIAKDPDLPTKIDRAVFPGLQGGPHDNTTAGIAQALYEASQASFRKYAKKIVENAKVLAKTLQNGSVELVGGGTDSHLILVDLSPQGLSGNVVSEAMEAAGIVSNRNSVPGDTSPFYPSGIRLGTPAVTTRGMGVAEMKQIGEWILSVIRHVGGEKLSNDPKERTKFLKDYRERITKDKFLKKISQDVKNLCKKFPLL